MVPTDFTDIFRSAFMNIAVLGLGIIGSVWARNWQADGLKVRVWNRTRKDFPGWCDDPVAAIEGAELIVIVVADPPAVEQVLERIARHLKPGQIVSQSSTISAEWTLKFAKVVESTGAVYLEAPFTGSKPAAEQRKTVFYLGGAESVVAKASPVLAKTSAHILHVGPLGAASALKLAMNMNIALVMQALSESRSFAKAQGLSDDIIFKALAINVSRSGISDLKEPKLRTSDFSPQFSLKHMNKDLNLAKGDAKELALPLFATLRQSYAQGMAAGWADEDFSVLARLLEAGR
jgi:3-hydroxyisobutyrate dehydrogenase-like beta-hydroxyacid dehydrogenase